MLSRRQVCQISGQLSIAVIALNSAALAGTPEGTAIFVGPAESTIRAGAGYLSEDSHHANRYTGPVEEGFYPYLELDLRYRGEDEDDARYGRLEGRDLGIESRTLRGRYGVQGTYGVFIEYDQRPRFYGEGLESPHWEGDRDSLILPEAGRTAELDEWTREWDLDTQRRQLSLGGQRHIAEDWKISAAFSREEKTGRRALGYGNWMGPQGVQLPAPVDQRTDQFDLNAEYANEELQAQFGYHLSMFSQLEENYFEFEDPNSVSSFTEWREADTRKVSRAPENTYHRIHAALAYQLQRETRIHTKLDLGRAQQDDDFIDDPEYADELSQLDGSLDGRIDTTRFALRGTHRFNPRFQIRGGYRFDDRDYQGSADQIGDYALRIHSLTRQSLDIDGDVRLPGRNNLLFGYEFEQTDREQADATTDDHAVQARLRSRLNEDLSGSVYARFLDRSGANYSGPGLTDSIQATRIYYLADLQRWEFGAVGSYSIIPELAVGAEVTFAEDDYDESEVGLLSDQLSSYTATLDYFPAEAFSGYTFITLETRERKQAGEQRSLDQDEVTWTLGTGVNATMMAEDRLNMGAELVYMDSETDLGVSGSSNNQDFSTLNIEMLQLKISGDYQFTDDLEIGLAYLMQRFKESDWSRGIGPGSEDGYIYMGSEERDYTAHMGLVTVGYQF
ncbi:MtrB/PioB family decaheme-associated outer membrane protein [Halorhodospira halochloris]|uniref:MtrB/PioB family decaheme-associated outer membrane protein n=1 Tax=Halorhodospira halochloris TaxID=1052 RepID=UPI001EE7F341|nr:MtrB/PioB family decaheme-associated outer membrane protein [Halorhodospira halochloris]MCG5529270.1 MtrB/PioB family decaheme-associated outer membrane protein [Halorhodospira halochloris]